MTILTYSVSMSLNGTLVTLDMKSLSKEELVARLRAIAADETPREEHYGAMCYSQMAPPTKKAKCDLCKQEFTYSGWNEGERIKSVVREMAKLGYDVKVETVCRSCAESLKAELHPNEPDYWTAYKEGKKYHVSVCDINFLFSFRTSPDVEYHRAIANNEDYYVSLLSLLKNSPMYFDSYDRNYYIADEKDVLQFMTGIDFNE